MQGIFAESAPSQLSSCSCSQTATLQSVRPVSCISSEAGWWETRSLDGYLRQRKLMIQLETSTVGSRFQEIMDLSFHKWKKTLVPGVRVNQTGFQLGQCFLLLKIYLLWKMWPISVKWWKPVWIRASKELLNPLDHANHVLMMGIYLVHMIYDLFPITNHGSKISIIVRGKTGDPSRGLRILTFGNASKTWSMVKYREIVKMFHYWEQHLDDQIFVWYYVEPASLTTRIKYTSNMTHFRVTWHNWAHWNQNLQLATKFITRKTYITCYCPVTLL